MTRSTHRILASALVATLGALLVAASSASALNQPCLDLHSQVSAASTGDTITIDQGYVNCSISYSGKSLIFKGTVPAAGFDGGSPIFNVGAGAGASFRDLTFKHGVGAPSGGAIDANGASSIEILRSRFLGNSGANGGAIYLSTDGAGPIAIRDSAFGSDVSGEGNTATNSGGGANISTNNGPVTVERSTFAGNAGGGGGGLYVSAQAPVLRDNSFVGNAATNGGGGAALFTGPSAEITRSRFVGNHVNAPASSPGQRVGGGLQAVSQGTITQTSNVFRDNSLTYNRPAGNNPFPSGGGGEFLSSDLISHGDQFIHNSAHNIAVGGDGVEGGGLFVFGCVGVPNPPRTASQATNLVAAGNSLTGGDEGAGVYVGCGVNPVDFSLNDSTIAGNTGGSPLDGGASDTLRLVNSIVSAGGKALSVTGFKTKSAAFSDACGTGGHALPGAGNFCTDPRLKNPAAGDAHQTSKSPTRDRGSNARVPSGLSTDFEGGARITDAQPDAKAIVDVGADETLTGRLVISSLKLSKATFRAAGRKPGTTIAFTITGPTPVRYSVARILSKNKLRAVGSFLHTAKAGRNHVKFTGRIGRTKLAPGRYRLTLKGKNRLNNRSNAISVTFVVAK